MCNTKRPSNLDGNINAAFSDALRGIWPDASSSSSPKGVTK